MTGLLVATAIITTIALLVSAAATGARATAIDDASRGRWGIARWTSDRRRPLNPSERRWQTALLSARDSPPRWRDVVDSIRVLERLGGAEPAGTEPEQYRATWVDHALTNLEAATTLAANSGDTNP